MRLGLEGIPGRTNQDHRDAIAGAMTARHQPYLCEDPLAVRPLMLDYVSHLNATHSRQSERNDGKLSVKRVRTLMTDIEQFYMFMLDHRDDAANALRTSVGTGSAPFTPASTASGRNRAPRRGSTRRRSSTTPR